MEEELTVTNSPQSTKLSDPDLNSRNSDTDSEYDFREDRLDGVGSPKPIKLRKDRNSKDIDSVRRSMDQDSMLGSQLQLGEQTSETNLNGSTSPTPQKRRKNSGGGRNSGQFSPRGKVPSRTRSKPIIVEHKKNLLGEVIYKGHQSWILMQDIQLGIRYAVGRNSHLYGQQDLEAITRKLHLHPDFFKSPDVVLFPTTGSDVTPAHKNPPFKFKDYMPLVFRHLREKFKIDPSEYMNSLCNTFESGENSLIEVPTPGKSGSLFFFSSDMNYILKTIPKREAKLLRQLLPDYYKHVMTNSDTLLPKFFGLYRIKPEGGRQVRFVVMGNIFASHKKIHERFDLKGSTLGREVSSAEKTRLSDAVTYKDLDWIKMGRKLKLGDEKRKAFIEQLRKDCELLERLGVMDYSLLIGIHFTKKEEDEMKQLEEFEKIDREKKKGKNKKVTMLNIQTQDSIMEESETDNEAEKPPKKKKKSSNVDNKRLSTGSSSNKMEIPASPAAIVRSHSIELEIGVKIAHQQAEAPPEIQNLASPLLASPDPGDQRARHQSMVQTNFPLPPEFQSKRVSQFQTEDGGMRSLGKDEFYFVGIIDILMLYTLRKRAEHSYKMLRYGAASTEISSVNPKEYSQRFQKFVTSIVE